MRQASRQNLTLKVGQAAQRVAAAVEPDTPLQKVVVVVMVQSASSGVLAELIHLPAQVMNNKGGSNVLQTRNKPNVQNP
jgi:hypothetical protein